MNGMINRSKTARFSGGVKDTPGPIYTLPSLFNGKEAPGAHHVQGPVMRPESDDKSPRSTMTVPVPHPTRVWHSWHISYHHHHSSSCSAHH
jgi:hypothetical protein